MKTYLLSFRLMVDEVDALGIAQYLFALVADLDGSDITLCCSAELQGAGPACGYRWSGHYLIV
jgi:hypothetical protein